MSVVCNVDYTVEKFSSGPVPNASKRQLGSANLGSQGPLTGKATQGDPRLSKRVMFGRLAVQGPSNSDRIAREYFKFLEHRFEKLLETSRRLLPFSKSLQVFFLEELLWIQG